MHLGDHKVQIKLVISSQIHKEWHHRASKGTRNLHVRKNFLHQLEENVPHHICIKLRRSSQAASSAVSESIEMGSYGITFEQETYLCISE
jgi:hypothetical protein